MADTKKKPTAAEVTPPMIAEWKEKFGSVFLYKSEDGKVAYFKKPDRQIVDASSSLAKDHPVKSNELLAKSCFLGGDEEVISVDEYFFGLNSWLKDLIKTKLGELQEL